ncbi:hypothetical protein, partial [Enterobacter hormaechei]|uniref:hypothetical protein n=1 Tax=Enterobacter hormaechei TaxID=158836 RepID=UPI003D6E9D89
AMEYVKKIHDGVGSLELYTGKDVEVVNIVKGESAPSQKCESIASWLRIFCPVLYLNPTIR